MTKISTIVNLSDFSKEWNWLASVDTFAHLDWQHASSLYQSTPTWLPKRDSLNRLLAAHEAVKLAKKSQGLLVSHGPRPTMYGGQLAKLLSSNTPHLAYAFNFTDLPVGKQHALMTKAYQHPQRFVTFSTLERSLYAEYFDIPIEKIDMIHWSVHRPDTQKNSVPLVAGNYICALGSQARDYATLFAAMRQLPNIKLVVVTTPSAIANLSVPDNVTVLSHIPYADAYNVLTHSRFLVVPLRSSQVPCGHVTIVAGMFFEKAMIVTDSAGVHDYTTHNQTGLLVHPQDISDCREKIEQLWQDHALNQQLAKNGLAFANAYCTEKNVVNYFTQFLASFS